MRFASALCQLFVRGPLVLTDDLCGKNYILSTEAVKELLAKQDLHNPMNDITVVSIRREPRADVGNFGDYGVMTRRKIYDHRANTLGLQNWNVSVEQKL